jgi:phosphohistidine phosphatase
MRFYFLRHAEALDGWDDAARPLSVRGEHQAREMGSFLKRIGVEFDAAYSSPLVRARQTAERVLGVGGGMGVDDLEVVDAMRNETGDLDFQGWLRSLPMAKHVLLVGHNPSISGRVRELLGMSDGLGLEFAKCGLAVVRTADGVRGELKFYGTPKTLGF